MARKRAPAPIGLDEWKRCLFERPSELCAIYDDAIPDFEERSQAYDFLADPAATLALFIYTMRNMKAISASCSTRQAAYGLNYIFNGSYSNTCHTILAAAKSAAAEQLDAIRSIYDLYAGYLCHSSSKVLGSRNELDSDLDVFTYMLWDVTPLTSWAGVEDTSPSGWPLLSVLERVLYIPHDGCIESVLHGLGHMVCKRNGDFIAAIINRFVAATPGLRPELKTYALAARHGHI